MKLKLLLSQIAQKQHQKEVTARVNLFSIVAVCIWDVFLLCLSLTVALSLLHNLHWIWTLIPYPQSGGVD